MNAKLKLAATLLVEKSRVAGSTGSIGEPAEIAQLKSDLGDNLPTWYAELLGTFPLGGLDLGWQEGEQMTWMTWSTPAQMRSESLEAYPGLAILQHGYLNVASCAHGSGDPYFIPTNAGDDPPLYRVYHDVSADPDQILERGLHLICDSISTFFEAAQVMKVFDQ